MFSLERVDSVRTEGNMSKGIGNPQGSKAIHMLP